MKSEIFFERFILIYIAESKFFHCVEAMEREIVVTIFFRNKKTKRAHIKTQNLDLKH